MTRSINCNMWSTVFLNLKNYNKLCNVMVNKSQHYPQSSSMSAKINPFTAKSDQLQFSLSVSLIRDISHSMENLAIDSLY